jgi:hypothetical protein
MKEPRLKRNLGAMAAGSKRHSKHRRSLREELDEFYQSTSRMGRSQGWCLLGLSWKAGCPDVIHLLKKIQQQNAP